MQSYPWKATRNNNTAERWTAIRTVNIISDSWIPILSRKLRAKLSGWSYRPDPRREERVRKRAGPRWKPRELIVFVERAWSRPRSSVRGVPGEIATAHNFSRVRWGSQSRRPVWRQAGLPGSRHYPGICEESAHRPSDTPCISRTPLIQSELRRYSAARGLYRYPSVRSNWDQ